MKIRTGLVVAITIVVVFIAGLGMGDWLACARNQATIARLQGERIILKSEIERYVDAIRNIRSTASKVVSEEAATAPAVAEKGK